MDITNTFIYYLWMQCYEDAMDARNRIVASRTGKHWISNQNFFLVFKCKVKFVEKPFIVFYITDRVAPHKSESGRNSS